MDYGAGYYFLVEKTAWGEEMHQSFCEEENNLKIKCLKIAKAVESLTSETDKKELHDWKLWAKD